MTSTERCEISDLPRDMCGHCKPSRAEPESPNPAGFGPWFTAQFDSECDGPCGGEIAEGEQARSDGEGGWLCEACGGIDARN